MKHGNVNEFAEKPNPHGVSARTIYDHDEAQVVHILLKPGEGLKKHVTPVNVIFYVLQGEGMVEIGEESVLIRKDTIVESPARIPHRLYNDGHEDFRFLVMKVPKPKESTKVL